MNLIYLKPDITKVLLVFELFFLMIAPIIVKASEFYSSKGVLPYVILVYSSFLLVPLGIILSIYFFIKNRNFLDQKGILVLILLSILVILLFTILKSMLSLNYLI